MSDVARRIMDLCARLERKCGMGEYNSKNWREYVNKKLHIDKELWRDILLSVPLNRAKVLTSAYFADRNISFGDDKKNDEVINSISRIVDAFWLWRESKVIYKFDRECETALLEHTALSVDDDIPVEALRHLPHKHFFIENKIPSFSNKALSFLSKYSGGKLAVSSFSNPDNILGHFVNYYEQYDENLRPLPNGFLCISSVFLYQGTFLPFFASICLQLPNGGRHSFLDSLLVDVDDSINPDAERRAIMESYLSILQLILFLCAENAVVRPRGKEPKARRGKSVSIPKNVSVSDVLLPKISHISFPPTNRGVGGTSEKTGRVMPPHERRAHWHSYWVGGRKGSDSARVVLKWLAPMAINGGVVDDDRATEVNVR